MRTIKLDEQSRKNVLENLLKRSPNQYTEYESRVLAILEAVKAKRDEAVFSYTRQFDGYDLNAGNIVVSEEEIKAAYDEIDAGLLAVIRKAMKNIREYHEKQRQFSWFDSKPDGTILGQKVTALQRCICAGR